MFWGKQKQLENLLHEYQVEVRATVNAMLAAIERCNGSYDVATLKDSVQSVHLHEGRADDVRREIEVLMYEKSLFPESRGDILQLVESIDKIANQSEKAIWMMQTQHFFIPQEFQYGILVLARVSAATAETLLDASEKLFDNFNSVAEYLGKVDYQESEVDHMEADLIERVFLSNLDGFEKILLRDVICNVANVSDKAQGVADRIRIMLAKRSF